MDVLENYYNDRYAKWVWQNKNKVFDIKSIVLFIIPIVILFINFETLKTLAIVLEILVLLVLNILTKKKKEKKPFVVTARVKRMYFTYGLLFVLVSR